MRHISIGMLLIALCLTGCSMTKQDAQTQREFNLSQEKQESYTEKMGEVLDSFYWKYEKDSVNFFDSVVPAYDPKDNADIFEASTECGYNLKRYAGNDAIAATAPLAHFNGDKAGYVYFYFVRNNIVGAYYKTQNPQNKAYSLAERNVYAYDPEFSSIESDLAPGAFKSNNIIFTADGFDDMVSDENGCFLASIVENKVVIYKVKSKTSIYKTISFANKETVPLSTAFYDKGKEKGLVVLTGKVADDDTRENPVVLSDRMVFYDMNFNRLENDVVLSGSAYACVAADDEKIMLSSSKYIEYYTCKASVWSKTESFYTGVNASAMKVSPLESGGKKYCIMTDGMDFYVFKKVNSGFVCLWRTHISIDNYLKYIYISDLNRDGVKEIYACDNTGTTIRYVITDFGLVSRNDDIDYGQRILAGDFNDDNLDDYILIGDIEVASQQIYFAEP